MPSRKETLRPTINDVAKLAGVSKATVSRVVSGHAPVSEETAVRVRQAITELGYMPSASAQALSDRRTYAIGLLTMEITAPYHLYLLRGIESAAREAGLTLLISSVSVPARQPNAYKPFLGEHNTDGLIVVSGCLPDDELRRLHDLDFPIVLLHRTPPAGLPVPALTIDNRAGTRALIEHLIVVHGRKRIAFLRGPETEEDSIWREQGYYDALTAHDLPHDPALIGLGGFDERIANQTVSDWLAHGLAFDAVFTGDDESAPGVLNALYAAGLRVPEDVAVVGFDDDYLACRLIPALTTVRSPIEQMGRAAVHQLTQLIAGYAPQSQVLPTELVIRRSCGCV